MATLSWIPLELSAWICERIDGVRGQVETFWQVNGMKIGIAGKDGDQELVRDLFAAGQDQVTKIRWAARQDLQIWNWKVRFIVPIWNVD